MKKNMTLYQIGHFISTLGDSLFGIVLFLWILQISDSGKMSGTLLLITQLPLIFMMPLGGVIADRLPRKKTMIITDVINGTLMCLFAILMFAFPEEKSLLITMALSLGLVSGGFSMIFGLASNALLAEIAEKETYLNDYANKTKLTELAKILGKTLGGFLLSQYSALILIAANGISFIISAVIEVFIEYKPKSKLQTSKIEIFKTFKGSKKDFLEAIEFLKTIAGLKEFFLGAMINNFFLMMAITTMPLFFKLTLDKGTYWYGYASAAMAVGSILGGMLAKKFKFNKVMMTVCLLGPGICYSVISALRSPYLILLFMTLVGLTFVYVGVNLQTKVQLVTPNEMRGRVFSFLGFSASVMGPMGYVAGGFLMDALRSNIHMILILSGGSIILLWTVLLLKGDMRKFVLQS